MTDQPIDAELAASALFARQVAARRALITAIEELGAAHADDGLLLDWTLVTCQHIDHGNGDTTSAYGLYGPDDFPAHRLLGLLEYAATKVRTSVADAERHTR